MFSSATLARSQRTQAAIDDIVNIFEEQRVDATLRRGSLRYQHAAAAVMFLLGRLGTEGEIIGSLRKMRYSIKSFLLASDVAEHCGVNEFPFDFFPMVLAEFTGVLVEPCDLKYIVGQLEVGKPSKQKAW